MQRTDADTDTAATSLAHGDLMVVPAATVIGSEAFPGLERRVLAFNDELMLVEHRMAAGSVFPRHSHPEDQLAYLLTGRVRVVCADEEFEASAGDSFVIRGGVEHQVTALEESIALDVFNGTRADYLPWVLRR
jgi:quercetin dioxygenase-like cupin family protein